MSKLKIKIKKDICYYCWIENDLQKQMIAEGRKAEPMWFVMPNEYTKRQLIAMRKFKDAQKQKCMVIDKTGLCYEHLQELAKRLHRNLTKKSKIQETDQ